MVGHPVNLAMQVDNIETSSAHGLGPVGLLAEASVAHPAGLLVRLLGREEVLSAVLMVVVTLEASMGVAASGAPTAEVMEETMGEAAGKLKE
jgi:hypothetical protein